MSDLISEVPASSPDFQSEAAQKLASLFPEVIADGKIDVVALQTLLGADAAGGGAFRLILARQDTSDQGSSDSNYGYTCTRP